MRGTAAVAGTLVAGGAAHDKQQREQVDQAGSERHPPRRTDQVADAVDFEAASRRIRVAAVLVLVTLVQVAWVFALGYGVFVLVQ
jgi:hypothetical protein